MSNEGKMKAMDKGKEVVQTITKMFKSNGPGIDEFQNKENDKENNDKEVMMKENKKDVGYFDYILGDSVHGINNNLYTLVKLVGKGTYGLMAKFSRCMIRKGKCKPNFFALKVVRNTEEFHDAGLQELKILEALTKLDPKQHYVFSRITCKFSFDYHICFGIRLLGMNLYRFMKKNHNNQFPICQVRHIMYQLAHTLQFLHENHYTHTDLKLENIVFVDSSYDEINIHGMKFNFIKNTRVCLIDYGGAQFGNYYFSGVVSTKIIRAPEIFLKRYWDSSIDIWSLGCVLYELFTGYEMFSVERDVDQLILMEKVFGKFPESMINCDFGKDHFKDGIIDMSNLAADEALNLSYEADTIKKSLTQNLGDLEVRDLTDLLLSMLKLNPSERISAEDVLKHKFFNKLTIYEKLAHGISNEDMVVDEYGRVTGITCSCIGCENITRRKPRGTDKK